MNVRTVAVCFGLLLMCQLVQADNWPQFRGPQGDGIVRGSEIPLQWGTSQNVKWTFPNPGEGWSSPVTWGDRLFLTAAVLQKAPAGSSAADAEPERYRGGGGRRRSDLMNATYQWMVYCLDTATGELIWKRVARVGKPTIPRHSSNTYATETPVTDGQRVYAYFGMTGLYCYDFEGNLLWEKDLGTYEMRAGWGTSSSPALHDGKLFVQVDNEDDSFIVALSCADGSEVWRVGRNERSQYSSPIIWKNSQRAEVITGGMVYRSYDPHTGELLWKLDMAKGRSSASPLPDGDRLYVGTEFRNRGGADDGGGFLFAVKAGAQGDITPREDDAPSDSVLWRCPQSGIQMASPVVCREHIYLLDRRSSILNVVNADTGEMVYRKRIPGAGAFWASPWVYDGKVFCPDDRGTTHVLQAGPEFEVLAANAIDEQVWATAAIANDSLFLRGAETLYCISAQSGQ